MATYPYFVVSPSTVLSLIGVLRGPDQTRPTPAEDWAARILPGLLPRLISRPKTKDAVRRKEEKKAVRRLRRLRK